MKFDIAFYHKKHEDHFDLIPCVFNLRKPKESEMDLTAVVPETMVVGSGIFEEDRVVSPKTKPSRPRSRSNEEFNVTHKVEGVWSNRSYGDEGKVPDPVPSHRHMSSRSFSKMFGEPENSGGSADSGELAKPRKWSMVDINFNEVGEPRPLGEYRNPFDYPDDGNNQLVSRPSSTESWISTLSKNDGGSDSVKKECGAEDVHSTPLNQIPVTIEALKAGLCRLDIQDEEPYEAPYEVPTADIDCDVLMGEEYEKRMLQKLAPDVQCD